MDMVVTFFGWLAQPATFSVSDIWLHLAVATILVALAVYTWFYRQRRGGFMAVLAFVNAAAELLIAVVIAAEPGIADKFLGFKVLHLSMVPMSTIWLVMVIQIGGWGRWLSRPVVALLVGLLAFSWLAVLTNDWLGLYWRDLAWDGERLRFLRGPAYLFGLFYNYVHIVLAFILNLKWALSSSGLRRWQALSMLVAPLFGVTGNILWNLERSFLGLAPTPTGFLLMGLTAGWGFSRFKVFSLVSQAQATVTASSSDGIIIIDDQDYIVEQNPVASKTCGKYSPKPTAGKFQEGFSFWPDLVEIAASPVARKMESELADEGERRFFELSVSILYGDNDNLLGKVIVARDISEQKKAQAQLLEQQKALSITAERERLGRELHDGPGQIWNYLNLKLQTVRSLMNGGRIADAGEQVDRLIGTITEMNTDARESIVGLKATAGGNDFVANLQDYLAWYEESNGIAAKLIILPDESAASALSCTCEVQLLRIIQEALTNTRKHAKASQVTVKIEKGGRQVNVLVEDDGCGFDPATMLTTSNSFGLQIMAERAQEAGGVLRIESTPGAGTKLMVEFDLDKVGYQ